MEKSKIEVEVKPNENLKEKGKELSYKDDLWMYFEMIKNKFFIDRNKARGLLHIIIEKNKIDLTYSQSLRNAYNDFAEKYRNEDSNLKSAHPVYSKVKESSINPIIDTLINNILIESEEYQKKVEFVYENIINPLEGLIKSQCELSQDLIDLMINYQNEFKIIIEKLNQKNNHFQECGKLVEKAFLQLETINDDYFKKKKKKEEDPSFDFDEGIAIELISKFNLIKETNIAKAKIAKEEYESYLYTANLGRNKYVELSQNIYNKMEFLDIDYINFIKKKLISLIEDNVTRLKKFTEKNNDLLIDLNKIDARDEIDSLINSKVIKFYPPKPFIFIEYSPISMLRKKKTMGDTSQKEMIKRRTYSLQKLFGYSRNLSTEKDNEDEALQIENNLNFINDIVITIWNGEQYDEERLKNLLCKKKYRLHFLLTLNQFRVEGLFSLEKKAYESLVSILNFILEKSINESDYENIKSLIILSQTFYLSESKETFLMAGIESKEVWQSKEFWKELIEFSICNEINYAKGYKVFLEENQRVREERAKTEILGSLIAYLYNMKLFMYPRDKRKELIDEFIKKYNIESKKVYANDVPTDDIIESETIIENELNNQNSDKNDTI